MDQLWANRAASAEAADRETAPAESCGSCPAPSSAWSPGRRRSKRPVVRHVALLVAGAPARLPGRRADARPAARAQGDGSSARSAATHWRNNVSLDQRLLRRHGLAGAGAGAGGRLGRRRAAQGAATSWPTSSSTPGCPRTAAASRGASRTSSSTPPPTGPRASSWRATTTGCVAPSRWPTGSTRR